MTTKEIQAINPKDLFEMLTDEQRRKIWYLQEVEYVKEDIEQDFWRWGELEEIPEELEQALKENAGFIYEYVEEEKENLIDGQYAEIIKDAVKCAIETYNLLNK